jgi:dTDP-4-dehydrorhamnose 3,5-epimerase
VRFTVVETRLQGPLLIEPAVFGDDRGFFSETFRQSDFAELGITETMVQHNHSRSARGVCRGMHFQIGRGTSKLVRCARGTIVDVLVDIRRGSPTYGEWEAYELSDATMRMLYAPIGFAHGFVVVSDVADVIYQQDQYYSADVETGFAYDDPDVAIEWPLPVAELQVSERDRSAPRLSEMAAELPFAYVSPSA